MKKALKILLVSFVVIVLYGQFSPLSPAGGIPLTQVFIYATILTGSIIALKLVGKVVKTILLVASTLVILGILTGTLPRLLSILPGL